MVVMMAKGNKLTDAQQVAIYLEQMNHPLTNIVKALRGIILATDTHIGELVKWNSLSFQYTGQIQPFDPKEYKRDIVVFNPHKKDVVLLVFPTGAGVNDESGLLEGKFTDGRKIAKFTSVDEVNARASDLQNVLKKWLSGVK